MDRMLIDAKEVAKSLSISRRTLHSLTAPRGPIPSVKIGVKVLFQPNDVANYVESLKGEANGFNQQ